MKFLILFAAWATLAFLPSWFLSHPYQHVLAGAAGRVVAPAGSEIEFQQLELFYPFDLGIYVALCLASTWAPLKRRGRALGIGLPVKTLMGLMANPAATDAAVEQALRFSDAVIRVTGLIAAAAVWFYFLGRERISLAARAWLGG
jgi:hypothetical protein